MGRDVPRAVAPTPALAAAFGARWIATRAEAAIAARGVFTVALAGGESPRPLHESLAARDDIAWPQWEFFLDDGARGLADRRAARVQREGVRVLAEAQDDQVEHRG